MKSELSAAATSRGSAATVRPAGGATRKLAELTSEKIEMRIIEMDWPVGKVIGSEAELLGEYGVSRAALREAIRLLEHHHVAYMRRGPGGGLVVAEPDPDAMAHAAAVYLGYRKVSPKELFETRTALELAAVRSAAENIDEAGIVKLRNALAHGSAEDEHRPVHSHDPLARHRVPRSVDCVEAHHSRNRRAL